MKRATLSPFTRPSGFSLVELMVAITIGLILLAGVVQIFSSSKQAYRVQEATSRLQENGRFAIEFLARDIREAGYQSCGGKLPGEINTTLAGPNTFDFAVGLQGFDGSTDRLVLLGVSGRGIPIKDIPNVTAANFKVDAGHGLSDNQIVMVTDCKNATTLQITNANGANGTVVHNTGLGSPGNSTVNLGGAGPPGGGYQPNVTEIIPVKSTTYSIGAGAGGLSLMRDVNGGGALELIEGVDDMQILYDVDTNADRIADTRNLTANNVANMSQVVSVQVSLLLRTLDDNVSQGAQSYTFNGAAITATDRRLRRVFTTTVALRNRTL